MHYRKQSKPYSNHSLPPARLKPLKKHNARSHGASEVLGRRVDDLDGPRVRRGRAGDRKECAYRYSTTRSVDLMMGLVTGYGWRFPQFMARRNPPPLARSTLCTMKASLATPIVN